MNYADKLEIEYENKFWDAAYEALPRISALKHSLNELHWAHVFGETTEYRDIAGYSYDMLRTLEDRLEVVLKNIERKRAKRAVELEKKASVA